jgi:hypothetical protein
MASEGALSRLELRRWAPVGVGSGASQDKTSPARLRSQALGSLPGVALFTADFGSGEFLD